MLGKYLRKNQSGLNEANSLARVLSEIELESRRVGFETLLRNNSVVVVK